MLSMIKFKLTTPILYLVFNRFDSVKKTFPEIQKAKPKKLFIACDGPRTKEEKKKTDAVRKYILENINWKCKVEILFRDNNLGCKYAVAGAIDWFFENVDEGIILEDDCFPDQSFFRFCQEMLKRYRNDDRIMNITGQNALGKVKIEESYIFSKYFFCWGWATWKRSWEKMDLEMDAYRNINRKDMGGLFFWFLEKYLLKKRFRANISNCGDSWATSFLFSQMYNKKLCVIPKNNLIENIGFSEFSTHTEENKYDIKFLHRPRDKMIFPLGHPKNVEQDKGFDKKFIIQNIKRIALKRIGI